ncbi:hypothetical protein HU200_056845 [Digitaria exilis]|uniref:K-box domain-containing protein n=1 Tax=Digitaria exilis TaxID=1010633 RepID=A0A835E3L7_9POAL|nr:hypothetical protein HU200_056844 [Digitaria exilis]KAF8661885.1 hypothetical protein HU200_056845 [Digitaria exilis]
MGEELSGLTIRDLQFLQSQVEMSLQSIRKKKEQVIAEEIMQLNQKGIVLQKENVELKKEVSIAYQYKIELQNKLSAEGTSGGDNGDRGSGSSEKARGRSKENDASEHISLALSIEGHADE